MWGSWGKEMYLQLEVFTRWGLNFDVCFQKELLDLTLDPLGYWDFEFWWILHFEYLNYDSDFYSTGEMPAPEPSPLDQLAARNTLNVDAACYFSHCKFSWLSCNYLVKTREIKWLINVI